MKRHNWILFFCLFGITLFIFLDSLSHVIIYHEQHNLFLFSNEYLQKHLTEASLRLNYVTNFIIQFFYFPFLGAILVALLLSTLYLFNTAVTYRIVKSNDPLQLALIPPLLLLVAHTSIDFKFDCLVGVFLTTFVLYLTSFIKERIRYIFMPLGYLLLMILIGWRFPTYAVIVILFSCLSAFCLRKIHVSRKVRISLTAILLICYTGCTFYWFVKSFNNRERIIVQANSYTQTGEWKEVLNCARRYRGDNQLIDYLKNLALYNTGRMPHDLLDYSQTSGPMSLYLPWTGEGRRSEYGHYIYEQLGYLNEAHRWVFESMVVNGETAPVLLNLIRYNIAMKRPHVALRFINVLNKSLFYRKDALMYEKIAFAGQVPGLKSLEYDNAEATRFANVINLGPELIYILKKEPTSRMAFEYLMSFLLLSNDLPRFMEYVKLIDNFDYPEIPRLYQEAMQYYKMSIPRGEFEKFGFTVSPETEERFKEYHVMSKANNTDLLEEKFGNTYWFYINHKSSYNNIMTH